MASSLWFSLLHAAIFLLMQTLPKASSVCSDCFVQSRAAYYPNSDEQGTDSKRILLNILPIYIYID